MTMRNLGTWMFLCLFLMTGLSQRMYGQAPAVPTLEATLDVGEKFRDGTSLMWSPVGNAAWSALLDFHHVDKIHLEPRSATAEKLNAFPLDQAKVLPPSTLTFAGADSAESREKVRAALRKHVGENAAQAIDPFVSHPDPAARMALIVCALGRKPFFPSHFAPNADPRLFTDRLGVHHRTLGFGTSGRAASTYGDAVRVLADDLAGHHVLRLDFFASGGAAPEFLVLSTPGKQTSLEEAIKEIRILLAKKREPERRVEIGGVTHRYTDTLEAVDELWVPYLQAALLCDYPDLTNKTYLKTAQEPTGWVLREARQLLSWKLDHQGAVVETLAMTAPGDPFGPPPEKEVVPINRLPLYRKSFVFNKSFVATVWREGADWPYLACWIDGPDMLMGKK